MSNLIYRDYIDNPPRTSTQFADIYESIMGRYDLYRGAVDTGQYFDVVCKNGHPRTPDNTYQNDGNNYMRCRVCQKERNARRPSRAAARNRKLVTV